MPQLEKFSNMSDPAFGAAVRGLLGRCPRCGLGRLFSSYLKVVQRCSDCGERYGHYRSDDAAPWLTILVVRHIIVPLILLIEELYAPPPWVGFTIYPLFVLALTLTLLPRCKGAIIAMLWKTKAEGSEEI
ncbi:MAG: DUF983 domain-containing protein [Afipia sp.]|nr:DUF983 domain-containing protein [Afipia sp.]